MPARPRGRRSRLALAGVCVAGGVALAPPARAIASVDARVQGTFTMHARVTTAVDVRGERRGERLIRRWTIQALGCRKDVCRTLRLVRQRAAGFESRLTLHRTGPGRYRGRGDFYAPLACSGHVDPRGSRAPYLITLTVTRSALSGGVRFAEAMNAGYANARRVNLTACASPHGHDAARYTGRLTSRLPQPPRVAFAVAPGMAGEVRYRDRSRPRGAGIRLASRAWSFGDPASGSDHATAADPTHTYQTPGTYRVRLVETDSRGLRATRVETVIVPGPTTAASTGTITG